MAPGSVCQLTEQWDITPQSLTALVPRRYLRQAVRNAIHVRGAYRNNLQSVDLDIQVGTFTVVTGLSGSGKSSLAFDTIYAEGQRRYVETFSAYTRQFLERMDKPQAESIEGIPPAIAVDQTNPVRTSRSTVGTMTELADHLKLLWSHTASLHCRGCDRIVRRDTPESIWDNIASRIELGEIEEGAKARVLFTVRVPSNRSVDDIIEVLQGEGYHRFHEQTDESITVVQDRVRLRNEQANRIREAVETAMLHGNGACVVSLVDGPDLPFSSDLHCPHCDIHYSDPVPNSFSFNSPVGACPTCRGFGRTMGIDYELVIPDGSKSLRDGAVRVWESKSYDECKRDMLRFAKKYGIRTDIPWNALRKREQQWVIEGEGDYEDGQWYGLRRFFDWLESKSYKMHIRVLLSKYRAYRPCTDCDGARLKPESLQWKIQGHSIHDINILPIDDVRRFFDELSLDQTGSAQGHDEAGELVLGEIRSRLSYLSDVGVGYLTLDRQSRTLSGGEVQRINLTTALGTRLTNTLFVLDEPSIGLHSRDIDRLIRILRRLCEGGNTLLVVEHDPQVIAAADRVVELGPGAGRDGGTIVFEGTPPELPGADTATGRWFRESAARSGEKAPVGEAATTGQAAAGEATRYGERASAGEASAGTAPSDAAAAPAGAGSPDENTRHAGEIPAPAGSLRLTGASGNNLDIADVSIPLNQLVCVTGVSGSGKSTLVEDTLYRALLKAKGEPVEAPCAHEAIEGVEAIDKAVLVDQSSIGKTARSNPASYVGAFDEIRKRFAAAPLAVDRGYTPGTFSFNSGNGRCPTCGGTGFEHVEMQFLSDVYLRCPDCDGTRYRSEILDITVPASADSGMRPANMADVLSMTVSDAMRLFADDTPVRNRLQPLIDVGLEYLTLGQPVPTLSGGEAQRLKLAAHLTQASAAKRDGPVLFLFDEPTTGLHAQDVARLLSALRSLLREGHSIIVIEHNLDVISNADWIIDIGPDGGRGGGRLVATGSPESLVSHGAGHTAEALRGYRFGISQVDGFPVPVPQRTETGDLVAAESPTPVSGGLGSPIGIMNAREHNLQNISVEVPQGHMTVLTGVSGSGKSTLAFDILFSEGQRRYLESLNAYARQFVQPSQRPEVDAVYGLPPSVAIEQRTSRGGWKSTVATTTELFHFIRLLFLKLGTQYCPDCDIPIEPRTRDAVLADIMREYSGERVTVFAPLVVARKGYYTDLAAWAAKKGFSSLRVDGEFLPTGNWPRLSRYKEHTIDLPVAEVDVTPGNEGLLEGVLADAFSHGNNQLKVAPAITTGESERAAGDDDAGDADEEAGADDTSTSEGETGFRERLFSIERSCPSCGTSFPELDPRLFSFNSKHGACEHCHGQGYVGVADEDLDAVPGGNDTPATSRSDVCPSCGGSRLNRVARSVFFRDMSVDRLASLSVDRLYDWITGVKLESREAAIARDIIAELSARLGFLRRVGLGYLGLDRAAPTLSGGEAQRIRLAAQLGSNLQGVCYVLDEPTIGLHARDNRMLLDTLGELRDRGNTIVVVEHDAETIQAADYVVDLGPGGGVRGGHVVAAGTVEDLKASPESRTGRAIAHPPRHPSVPRKPRAELQSPAGVEAAQAGGGDEAAQAAGGDEALQAAGGDETAHTTGGDEAAQPPVGLLRIEGATLHNLKNIDLEIPLGRLTCVTGVSGCGKSTLARGVLRANTEAVISSRRRRRKSRTAGTDQVAMVGCRSMSGLESVDRVLEVDQTPIGKTPRSCPATYVGIWDDIRRLFASTPEAKLHGFDASRFSFNTKGGRCEECGGQGVVKIEMSFLPDVRMQCELCGGARFTPDTLAVRYKGKSIADVLEMSIEEAKEFFSAHRKIRYALTLLDEVGLGYLKLGQQSPTLSGGEAQRLKLVTELAKAGGTRAGHTLYVLDEPTIGLHISDVERLTRVLMRLVDAGNTVVVVEHNLDLIAEADRIIDLGPEGGDAGGYVVSTGDPVTIAGTNGYTGQALAEHLAESEVKEISRS